MKQIAGILAKYENRPEVLANYFGWLVVEEHLQHFNKRSQLVALRRQDLDCKYISTTELEYSTFCKHQAKAYKNQRTKRNSDLNRINSEDWWVQNCFRMKKGLASDTLLHGNEYMQIALESMYVRRYYKIEHKQMLANMVHSI